MSSTIAEFIVADDTDTGTAPAEPVRAREAAAALLAEAEPVPEPVPAPKPETAAATWDDGGEGSRLGRAGAMLFFLASFAVLLAGWQARDAGYLTAEEGTGYWLGIIGAVLMLALVLYPMRKRARFMRRAGAVKHWFRAHMVKGVVGPICILYHAGFQTGSLNASVALWAMVVVATSGLVGRYFYVKIHDGLYGSRASLSALREGTAQAQGKLAREFAFAPQLTSRLTELEQRMESPRFGALGRAWRIATVAISLRIARNRMRRFMGGALALKAGAMNWSPAERRRHKAEAYHFLDCYLSGVRRVVEFRFYERLFSMWHLLHMPLFLMLVVAGIVHVVAVHLY